MAKSKLCVTVNADSTGYAVYLCIGSGDANTARVLTAYDKQVYATKAAKRWADALGIEFVHDKKK